MIPFLGIHSKELKARSQRDICAPMFIAALFTIAQRWGEKTQLKWIRKMWSTQTMEYDSALKRRVILTRATTWMNLENITLSEASQTHNDSCCLLPFIRGTETCQIHRNRKENGGCQGLGRGWDGSHCVLCFFFAVPCSMQDLGFPTGNQTCAPCIGSAESTPLDCQGLFKVEAGRVSF